MSTIDISEVERVAALARISLTESEMAQIATDLSVISQAVARVSEAVSSEIPATSHPIPLTNVLRADELVSTLSPAQALSGAPAAAEDKFLVPQILGEE